jgi:hypothetical protein
MAWWLAHDFREVGFVSFTPYLMPVIWCIVLGALPWSRTLGRLATSILLQTIAAAKRNKRRIALSLPCLMFLVFVLCLWIRSYQAADVVQGVVGTKRLQFMSDYGAMSLFVYPERDSLMFPDRSWFHQRMAGEGGMAESISSWDFRRIVPSGTSISAPHWFFSVTCVVIGALPWLGVIPWPTRFSLRTLLITITFAALALGLIIATTR